MKLPDFIQFKPFDQLRTLMRAPLLDNFSMGSMDRLTLADLEVMGSKGLDIGIDEIKVLPDGTLAYKDSRALLYIRDVAIYHSRRDEESLPKFHVANCSTLRMMRDEKRFERYVASIRKDGKFELIFIRGSKKRTATHELNICKNCLSFLEYKGYSYSKPKVCREVFSRFSIEEYFSIYPRSLIVSEPRHTNLTAPLNDYTHDFHAISAGYRNEKNWTCEKCSVDLSHKMHRRFLHVHHVNGSKYDNTLENLQALCIYCHAHEPMSGHMKALPDYHAFVQIRVGLKKRLMS